MHGEDFREKANLELITERMGVIHLWIVNKCNCSDRETRRTRAVPELMIWGKFALLWPLVASLVKVGD